MQATMPIEIIYEKAKLTLERHPEIKVVNIKVAARNNEGEDRWYIIAKVRREENGGVELMVDDLEAYLDQNMWLDASITDNYVYFHKRNKPKIDDLDVADGTRDEDTFEPIDIEELDPYARWNKGEVNARQREADEETEKLAKEAETNEAEHDN